MFSASRGVDSFELPTAFEALPISVPTEFDDPRVDVGAQRECAARIRHIYKETIKLLQNVCPDFASPTQLDDAHVDICAKRECAARSGCDENAAGADKGVQHEGGAPHLQHAPEFQANFRI